MIGVKTVDINVNKKVLDQFYICVIIKQDKEKEHGESYIHL